MLNGVSCHCTLVSCGWGSPRLAGLGIVERSFPSALGIFSRLLIDKRLFMLNYISRVDKARLSDVCDNIGP